jgi:methionyl-tRNA formyltransferase
MKIENTEYNPPLRIVLITTGFSDIVDFLYHNQSILLTGILECRYLDDNCCEYAKLNQILHCFYKSFVQMEKWLDVLRADLLITYRVPFLLPENIFEKPQYGSINIHPSLLPQYRGANPWFWIYYYMETKSGVTIHKIDKYEDHGDILAQMSFPVVIGSPLLLLQKEAEKVAINLLKQIFACRGNIRPISQENILNITYAKPCFDLKKLVELATLDGMRLWHILRGFPSLLKKTHPELKEHYRIGDFLRKNEQGEIGNIVYTDNGAYLTCYSGNIEILYESTP